MLTYMISLIATLRPLWGYALNYVFALAFVATVPCLVRNLYRGRG